MPERAAALKGEHADADTTLVQRPCIKRHFLGEQSMSQSMLFDSRGLAERPKKAMGASGKTCDTKETEGAKKDRPAL